MSQLTPGPPRATQVPSAPQHSRPPWLEESRVSPLRRPPPPNPASHPPLRPSSTAATSAPGGSAHVEVESRCLPLHRGRTVISLHSVKRDIRPARRWWQLRTAARRRARWCPQRQRAKHCISQVGEGSRRARAQTRPHTRSRGDVTLLSLENLPTIRRGLPEPRVARDSRLRWPTGLPKPGCRARFQLSSGGLVRCGPRRSQPSKVEPAMGLGSAG